MTEPIRVGVFPPFDALAGGAESLHEFVDQAARAGLDHVATGDHVSFFVGFGVDGLINATAMSMLHDSIGVYVSVYLLALRHPVLVARQLSTLSSLAPGRLTLGVGVGGEDRHEVEICSVDPSSRGRRTDECIQIVKALLGGQAVDFKGEFFDIERALVIPPTVPAPPIVIGGRSDAAIRRTGRYGDGWIGTWVSPDRFAAATAQIADLAEESGRGVLRWHHAVQTWCGFGESREDARGRVARAMQGLYRIPFEKFERWSPYGTPDDVAEELAPYLEAGCRTFNLLPQAGSASEAIAASAEVKRLLEGVS